MSKQLDITSQEESWRLRCPRGHIVTPTNEHWYCRECAQNWHDDDDINPELDEVTDIKTGETVTREDVAFDFDAPGVYYV